MEPVKVKFRKMENSTEIHETFGYYIDEADFNNRNPTLFFDSMTKKTKPLPKTKEEE